jgi:hypothetical protein
MIMNAEKKIWNGKTVDNIDAIDELHFNLHYSNLLPGLESWQAEIFIAYNGKAMCVIGQEASYLEIIKERAKSVLKMHYPTNPLIEEYSARGHR